MVEKEKTGFRRSQFHSLDLKSNVVLDVIREMMTMMQMTNWITISTLSFCVIVDSTWTKASELDVTFQVASSTTERERGCVVWWEEEGGFFQCLPTSVLAAF